MLHYLRIYYLINNFLRVYHSFGPSSVPGWVACARFLLASEWKTNSVSGAPHYPFGAESGELAGNAGWLRPGPSQSAGGPSAPAGQANWEGPGQSHSAFPAIFQPSAPKRQCGAPETLLV